MAQSSSTSSSESASVGRWPKAALWCVVGCLLLTGFSWAGVHLAAATGEKYVLLVGDSFTGNYRFDEGGRLQDLLEAQLPSEWSARNFARPGARTLDMLMQVYQAETLVGTPDLVVLPLFVTKLAVGKGYVRLDKRGDNLKWLPLVGETPVMETLSDEETKKLAIHKMGLLVGFYDLVEYFYVEGLQSPRERAEMMRDPPKRRARIDADNRERAKSWDTYQVDPVAIAKSPAAADLDQLVKALRQKGIPLLIVWLPMGNMDVVGEIFSPRAQSNLERVRRVALDWSASRGVASVDLVDGLPGAHYDDFTHLKAVAGNQIIVDVVDRWVQSNPMVRLQR